MAAGLALLVLILLSALVTDVAPSLTVIFHGHGLGRHGHVKLHHEDDEQEQEQEHEQKHAVTVPGGLHSFTHGRGVYKSMAHDFLEAHNRVRAKYGVPPLRWSNKLAKQARRWCLQRQVDCVMKHSFGVPYGENVFWGSGWDWRAEDAVGNWASEAGFYDWRSQTCYTGHECGHFTQLVWNDTLYVGCGRSECITGGVIITCNYDPPGNWKGEAPLS